MTLRADPKRAGSFSELSFFSVTVAAKIMEHGFDRQRDVSLIFVARITRIVTRIINVVMVAKRAFFTRVIEVFERNRQQRPSADHRVSHTVNDAGESKN